MYLVFKATSKITLVDVFACALIMSSFFVNKIVDYYFPKKVDLYKELEELKKSNEVLLLKIEEHESDLTSLKFGIKHK
jgi:hypothetical protein